MSRTVPQACIDGLDSSRIINARVTFRKQSLDWTQQSITNYSTCSTLDGISETGYYFVGEQDSYNNGANGFVRTGMIQRTGGNCHVAWQLVPDPTASTWAKWKIDTSQAITYSSNSSYRQYQRPNVWGYGTDTYLGWYDVDNRRAYSGRIVSDAIVADAYYTLPSNSHATVVPVRNTNIRGLIVIETETVTHQCTYIRYINGATGSVVSTLPGVIQGLNWETIVADAEMTTYSDGQRIYVYISGQNSRYTGNPDYDWRSFVVSVGTLGYDWSDVKSLTGMSYADDITKIKKPRAKRIDGEIYVTADYDRPGEDYAVIMRGPEDLSVGRDMIVDHDSTGHTRVSASGFSLEQCGNYMYAIGRSYMMRAPATEMYGVDQTSLKLQTTSIGNLVVSAQKNNSMKAAFNIDASLLPHIAIARNEEFIVEMGYDGSYAQIGKFKIDDINQPKRAGEADVNIVGRSVAVKALSDWTSDGYFDRWSCDKTNTDIDTEDIFSAPARIGRGILVETDDSWQNNVSQFYLKDLNVKSMLYNTSMSSAGGIVRATFRRSQSSSYPTYGIMIQYRNDSTPAESSTDDYTYGDGIAIEVQETSSSASDLNIYIIDEGEWTELTSTAIGSVYGGTSQAYVDMMVSYYSGFVIVWMKVSSATDWDRIVSYQVDHYHLTQMRNYAIGHTGVFAENVTPHTDGYPLNSDRGLVPVHDNSVFPSTNFVVRINDEKILVPSKTGNDRIDLSGGGVMPFTATEGYTFNGATHWSGTIGSGSEQQFTGSEIYLSHPDASTELDTGDLNRCYQQALVCVDGPGKGHVMYITGFDPEAPYQWNDTGGPYTLPETWMDHVGDLSYGSWVQDDTLVRVFVSDPKPRVLEGSVWNMVPGLHCCCPVEDYRGYDGTSQASHDFSTVSLDASQLVYVTNFENYTSEADNSLLDMTKMLASKVGITEVDYDARIEAVGSIVSGSKTYSSPDFVMEMLNGANSNFYVTITKESNGEGFKLDVQGETYGNALRLQYRDDSGTAWYNYDYVPFPTISRVPTSGWVRISCDRYRIYAWSNDRLLYASPTLYNEFAPSSSSSYVITVTSGAFVGDYIWPEADMITEYFSVDFGQRGAQLMSSLIGEKEIIWGDNQYGELKIRRNRENVDGNTALAPYTLAVEASGDDTDTSKTSRVMIESTRQYEHIDEDNISEIGNRFNLYNAVDLYKRRDIQELAERILDDANREYVTINGAADVRLEPNDIYFVEVDGVVKELYIDNVQFVYSVDEESAIMDMTLEGYAKDT